MNQSSNLMYEHVVFFSVIKSLFVTPQTLCFSEMIQPNIKLNVSSLTRRQSSQSRLSQTQVSKCMPFYIILSVPCVLSSIWQFSTAVCPTFFPYALSSSPYPIIVGYYAEVTSTLTQKPPQHSRER